MKVKRLNESATLPTKAHPTDLGFDLYASENVMINYNKGIVSVPTGIAIEFPNGFGGIIKDRSSMSRNGLLVCGGVIDPDYRGEIVVLFHAAIDGMFFISKGQKIAQLVLVSAIQEEIEETTGPLLQTVRGDKGFGSSGS